jgi:hypothetical protein
MINLIDKCDTLQGFANGRDIRKRNENKSWNEYWNRLVREILWRGAIKEEKYEKFFTPPESIGKSPSFGCDENTMLDLREHATSNFNLWSLNENRIRKDKNGKKINVNRGCGDFCFKQCKTGGNH